MLELTRLRLSLVGISTLCLALSGAGCVSSGKYKELEESSNKKEEELTGLRSRTQQQQLMIADLETKLGKKSSDNTALESNLQEMRRAMEELNQRKAETDKRLREFKELTARFKPLVDNGQLTVKIVGGRMLVALQTDVLFPSGSAKLSAEGKSALKDVGKILVPFTEKKFQIEGHTDNVPIKTATYRSNWDLASARALTVLETMVEAGMPPQRISAATFGETQPAKANDTPEGRAANRRIDIVVVPDLSSLPGFDELNRAGE